MDNNYMQSGPDSGRQTAAPVRRRSNGFAVASLILGIAALASAFTMTILPPVFFGSLSIILGLISRGRDRKLPNYSLAGVVCGASALVVNIAIVVISFQVVFSNPEATKEYWNMVNETYEQMTGMDFDELLESYGLNPEQLK